MSLPSVQEESSFLDMWKFLGSKGKGVYLLESM